MVYSPQGAPSRRGRMVLLSCSRPPAHFHYTGSDHVSHILSHTHRSLKAHLNVFSRNWWKRKKQASWLKPAAILPLGSNWFICMNACRVKGCFKHSELVYVVWTSVHQGLEPKSLNVCLVFCSLLFFSLTVCIIIYLLKLRIIKHVIKTVKDAKKGTCFKNMFVNVCLSLL